MPFENTCFAGPFVTLDGANSPKPPLHLISKAIIPPPMKISDVIYFSLLLIHHIFVHSRNPNSFSRQAKQGRLQFSGSGLDAWGDRAIALAAADEGASCGVGAEAARKGATFLWGRGMARWGRFFRANDWGGRKTPVSPNPNRDSLKEAGRVLFVPASFGLYSRAVWKFKAKEVFAAQCIGDPVHIFAGKLSRFHPLVKGRRTCSHGTGKFRLAHTFIGQSHFYFLRYGHCYHLKRIIQIFLVAVKKTRKIVCKRRAVLS